MHRLGVVHLVPKSKSRNGQGNAQQKDESEPFHVPECSTTAVVRKAFPAPMQANSNVTTRVTPPQRPVLRSKACRARRAAFRLRPVMMMVVMMVMVTAGCGESGTGERQHE
jgi:hypothetical protein